MICLPSTTRPSSLSSIGARVRAEDRVVAQQVRQRRVVRQVVDRDPLDVRLGRLRGAKHVTADAAEAVDSNAYGHARDVLPRSSLTRCERARSSPASRRERGIYWVSRGRARRGGYPTTGHEPSSAPGRRPEYVLSIRPRTVLTVALVLLGVVGAREGNPDVRARAHLDLRLGAAGARAEPGRRGAAAPRRPAPRRRRPDSVYLWDRGCIAGVGRADRPDARAAGLGLHPGRSRLRRAS